MRDYIENNLWIRDKDTNLVPFILNRTQLYVMKIIETLWLAGIPVRLIVLKARQEGISTLFEAIGFALASNLPRIWSQIISYDDGSVTSLYEICQRYYENLEDEKKHPTKYNTKSSIHYSDLDSKILIDTARNVKTARGKTINFVHISEMAMMEYVKDLLASVRSSVPKRPNTFVGVESTAKGIGNDFHSQWEKGSTLEQVLAGITTALGQSSYVKIFIPWTWDDGYVLKPHADFKLHNHDHKIYGNEVDYQKTYKLTLPQMAWRRDTIVNECDGSIEVFQQEYPINEAEAFLASGRTKFNKVAMAHYWELRKEPEKLGRIDIFETLEEVEEHYGGDTPDLIFEKDPYGDLQIWEDPKFKPDVGKVDPEFGKDWFEYIIGSDVAEGIEVDSTQRGKDATDWSVARVWKRYPWELVAMLRCKLEPDDYALELMKLGFYYGTCWIASEQNNHGFFVNKFLKNHYPMLYYYEVQDEKTDRKTRKFGWRTDQNTRPYMIDEFSKMLKLKTAVIPDETGLKEYLTFTVYPNGQIKAQRSKHDDIVMADCITYGAHLQMPMLLKEMEIPDPMKFAMLR